MKRIAIFGSPGSGKSTLARQLSALIGISVTHLDKHYFYPGWVVKPADEFRNAMTNLVTADCWIVDGNYLTESGLAGRIERADTQILLECPRLLCLWRVVWRAVRHYGQVRPDQADGCPERLDWEFLEFVWNYPAKTQRIRAMFQSAATEKTVLVLKNKAEVGRWLAVVQHQVATHAEP